MHSISKISRAYHTLTLHFGVRSIPVIWRTLDEAERNKMYKRGTTSFSKTRYIYEVKGMKF